MVNNNVAMNICNLRMMQCIVCHLTQLEPIDAHGKHKGLMNYNKNHGTSALKKHVCHEHPNMYKKWVIFIVEGCKNPK